MERAVLGRRHPARWLPIVLGLGLVLVACNAPTETQDSAPASDVAADREAVLEAHRRLVEAYQKADVEGFVLMLEKTDDVLIYHPRLEDRWVGIDEVQRNLPRMFTRLGKPTWLDVHLRVDTYGDVAWLTSHVVIESSNVQIPFTGRGTEVWVRRSGGWKLAHGHWSANPEFERAAL